MNTSRLKFLISATLALGMLTLARPVGGTNPPKAIAESVIAEYHSDDPVASVRGWQGQMTRTSGNPRFNEFQRERLEEWQKTEFAPHLLDDPRVAALVLEIIRPALTLYRRQDCFRLLVVEHRVPVAMNDSGVLLMVTTGLVDRATSDDEILGHVAHELNHDIHWRRTARARQMLELYGHGAGTEILARREREELAKIELECDAFSAVTLAAMGRNPTVFGRYLLATGRDFPNLVAENMPPVEERARVIERVVPVMALNPSPSVRSVQEAQGAAGGAQTIYGRAGGCDGRARLPPGHVLKGGLCREAAARGEDAAALLMALNLYLHHVISTVRIG